MSRKILILTTVHPWNDIRIYHKEAKSLAKIWPVFLAAPAPFPNRNEGNLTIIGLRQWKKKSDRLRNIPAVLRLFFRFRKEIIHLHDPELLVPGLIFARLFGTDVLFDMHEDFIRDLGKAHWLPNWLRQPVSQLSSFLLNQSRKHFRHFFLAEDSYQKYFEGNFTIIHNYPDLSAIPEPLAEKEKDNSRLYLGYIGGITVHRGVALMGELLQKLDHLCISTTLELVGPFKNDGCLEILEAVEKKLSQKIKINRYGRMNFTDGIEIIRHCHVGLSIIANHPNYIHSYPTKLFEYMALKLPVITSNFPLYQDVIEQNQAGFCIAPEDRETLTGLVVQLWQNPKLRNEMGENGRKAALEKYQWAAEAENLEKVYESYI
jgi:glycosyltransferase involved in cell wall biosynthesis